jgi:hypothetical protein
MVIRKIHKIRDKNPETLPHAHLYLEDVKEITNILLEATAPALTRFREEAKVVYRAGDSQTDTSTIFELRVAAPQIFRSASGHGRSIIVFN